MIVCEHTRIGCSVEPPVTFLPLSKDRAARCPYGRFPCSLVSAHTGGSARGDSDEPVRLMIVDDHAAARLGLRLRLTREHDLSSSARPSTPERRCSLPRASRRMSCWSI